MLRIFGVIGAFVISLLVLVVFFSTELASLAGEAALKRAGFVDVSVDVTTLTSGRLVLGPVVARHPDASDAVTLTHVAVTFDWRSVLREHRVKTVELGPGKIIASLSNDAEIVIGGMSLPKSAEGRRDGFPFDALKAEGFEIWLMTPGGQVNGVASGEFDLKRGGAFTLEANAPEAGIDGIQFATVQVNANATFTPDGAIRFIADFTGDIETERFRTQSIDIAVIGNSADWRSVLSGSLETINGQIRVDLATGVLTPVVNTLKQGDRYADLIQEIDKMFGEFTVSGAAVFEYGASGYSVKLIDRPFTLMSEKNDLLTLSSIDDQALFALNDGAPKISGRLDHAGHFTGYAELQASVNQGDRWAYALRTAFDRQSIGGATLTDGDIDVTGIWDGVILEGVIDGGVTIAAASIGQLRTENAPVTANIEFKLDRENQTLIVAPDGRGCVKAKTVSLRVLEQGMESDFRRGQLCAQNEHPLASFDWQAQPVFVGLGVFQADRASYRLGATTFAGVPPSLSFAIGYQREDETTSLSGDFTGGSFAINDALTISQPTGQFSLDLKQGVLSGKAEVLKATLSQPGEAALMAPMSMAGAGTLKNNKITFDMSIATRADAPIAIGSGSHDIESGTGRATFQMPSVAFAEGGLQPDDITAALTGIISNASGSISGEVVASWDPKKEVRSSGAFELSDMTFVGPGRVVAQTRKVTGDLQLANLLPVATRGEQTIEIGAVDFGAIALTNGTVRFALPGDGTVRIINASFPWFGGTIGAYDTETPLSGGNAQALLRAEKVNLGDLLAELDVEGLSGEGIIEGVLPITIESGRARIENGVLSAHGPGIIRYEGKTTDAVAASNEQAHFAFDVLRELKFSKLSASINGPLDGNLSFNILIEGQSDIPINDPRVKDPVSSPVVYRVNLDAPLLALFDQARVSTDIRHQFQRQQQEATP